MNLDVQGQLPKLSSLPTSTQGLSAFHHQTVIHLHLVTHFRRGFPASVKVNVDKGMMMPE